jgi:cytochrome P450
MLLLNGLLKIRKIKPDRQLENFSSKTVFMSPDSIWSVDDDASENYFELLDDLRQSDPVHLNNFGDLVVMDYENVKKIFADSENFKNFDFAERLKFVSVLSANDPALREFSESLKYWLLFMNGPKHAEYRKIITKKFYEADYETITQEAIEEILNLYKDEKEADLVEISRQFSFFILRKIAGLKEDDYEFIQRFSYAITMIFEKTLTTSDLQACAHVSQEFYNYVDETLLRQEKELATSLMLEMRAILGREHAHETTAIWEFLMNAATETTALLINRSIKTLIENKEKSIAWQARDGCAIAVEELIRYVSPVNWIPRQVREEFEFEGLKLRKGQTVLLCIAAANRDPAVFIKASEFIPTRKPNPHIGFGFGIHHCLGARLSRLELQKFIPQFMAAFPDIRFDPAKPKVWDKKFFFRGLKHLPVLLK